MTPPNPPADVLGRLDALEATARAATPGPWAVAHHSVEAAFHGKQIISSAPIALSDRSYRIICGHDIATHERDANARHIAAFDPPTVLALIAVARAAQRWNDAQDGSREQVRAGDDLSDALSRLET